MASEIPSAPAAEPAEGRAAFGPAPALEGTAAEVPVLAGRLHPLSLVTAFAGTVRQWVVPAILLLLLGRDLVVGVLLLLLVAPAMLLAGLRWLTFRHRLDGRELSIRHGLFSRTERHVRLDRVQDVRIEQGPLHRLLRVADVHVETAGSKGPEAALSVLSLVEAEALRRHVLERAARARGAPAAGMAAPAARVLRRLSTREIVLGGLTSTRLASAFVVIGMALSMLSTYTNRFEAWLVPAVESVTERFLSQSETSHLVLVVAGAAGLLGLAAATSVSLAVAVFHGFTLSLVGEDVRREHGLLTRRVTSLPRTRLQAFVVEEALLRRLFGLAAMRADTAGSAVDRARATGRDVLLPVVPVRETEGILKELLPASWTGGPIAWRPVSRRAIGRLARKGAALSLLATAAAWSLDLVNWPVLLGLVPVSGAIAFVAFRGRGLARADGILWTRSGWLGRRTHVVPVRNVQAVVVRQTPFDRRLGLASLAIDTAGQAYTGGGPRVADLPAAEALALARSLAAEAARSRFRT